MLRVTISIGVSEWQRDETAAGFFHRVDHALYQAKRNGRDQVVMAAATLH
jgi:PleD family two-component response regulator